MYKLTAAFPSALLATTTLLAVTGARPGLADADLRLGSAVVPTFESVRLDLNADKPDYKGSVHVELQVKETTSAFSFHARDLQLDRMGLAPVSAKRGSHEISLTHERGETGLVRVTTQEPLVPGAYVLDIDFSARFGTKAVGLYRMDQEGHGYAFTQFEPDDARAAFPCWDEPGFKNPWQLTLAVPEGHTAVSNTQVEKETVKDGTRTLVFRKTKPLPSYLIAIAAGPLEVVPITGMSVPGHVVTIKGQSGLAGYAAQSTPAIVAALERWFGSKYPFEKLDLIAVPEFWPGAMENPGAVTFAAPNLLVDPKSAAASQRRSLVRVTAHELAHMWFGDLVTMQWWDDLWLNESFADWLGDKIAEETHPEFAYLLGELQGRQNIMEADARPSSRAIRKPVVPSDNMLQDVGTAYSKGRTVLGMFEQSMGPEKFRRGVLDYIQAHAGGNATAKDLFAALSKVSGQDVGAAMGTFLDQGGVPLVSVELLLDGRLQLSQRRFLNYGVQAEPRRWQIPVQLAYSDGKTTRTETVFLSDEKQTVSLHTDGAPAWIFPDAGAHGYYRWSVPPVVLQTLASSAPRALAPAERVAFLDNLTALLDTGSIHGDDYLRALGPFADDPEPQVVASILSGIEKIKAAFVPDELQGSFAGYVRQTLGPALARFGMDPKPGEDETVTTFRPQLLATLGNEGADEKIVARATDLARSYLADPTSVDPSLVSAALGLAAQHGDRALWDEYRSRAEAARVPAERSRFLSSLGSFRDPALVEATLKYALEGPLRPQEIFQVTRGMGSSEARRERLYRWMTENYDAIKARIPPANAAGLPRFASGCQLQRLEAAKAFFSDPAHDSPGTSNSLARVTDQVTDCVGLREREGAAVTAYLSQLVGKR